MMITTSENGPNITGVLDVDVIEIGVGVTVGIVFSFQLWACYWQRVYWRPVN
jgi:hypothetical protein